MGKHLFVFGHGYDNQNRLDPGATGSGTSEHKFLNEEFLPVLKKYAPPNVDFYTTPNMYARREAKSISGYDSVTELHLDWANGASGGHVIIYKDYDPDDIDLKIRDIVKKYVGLRMSSGISRRDNLYNLNTFAQRGITYRLVELGFINHSGDMQKIRDNIHDYARELLEAVTGKEIDGNSASSNAFRKDDKGSGVTRVQNQLMDAGFDLPEYGADGHYGDEMENVVRKFQKANGLKVDGIAGPKTQAKLKEVLAEKKAEKEDNKYQTQEDDNMAFKDVSKDAWYAKELEEAEKAGIAKGEPSGDFKPDEPVTRAEAAVFALRAYKNAKK